MQVSGNKHEEHYLLTYVEHCYQRYLEYKK